MLSIADAFSKMVNPNGGNDDTARMWLTSIPWTAKKSTDPWLADRRRSYRHRVVSPVTITDQTSGQQYFGVVTNVSLFGIAIRINAPVNIASTFTIDAESKTLYLPSHRAQVKSCRKTSDNRFDLGMEFVGMQPF